MRIFNRPSLFRILLEVRTHAELDRGEGARVRLLAERHGAEDVTVITQDAVMARSRHPRRLTLAVAAIAASRSRSPASAS